MEPNVKPNFLVEDELTVESLLKALGIRRESRLALRVADLFDLLRLSLYWSTRTIASSSAASSSDGSTLLRCNIWLVGRNVDFGGTVGEAGSFIEVEEIAKSVVLIGALLKGFLRLNVPTSVAAIGFEVGVGVLGLVIVVPVAAALVAALVEVTVLLLC